MSIDKLQDKIRKMKNPSFVEMQADIALIPKCILEESDDIYGAILRFSGELLDSLKEIVPGVRFSLSSFALLGSEGLTLLKQLTQMAQKMGYYVLLDAPVSYTEADAEISATTLMSADSNFTCDGVLLCSYIGADAIKPYADRIKESGKDVFVVLRTGNKTAAQLQDLLTGTRLVHTAAADIISRIGQPYIGRKNYSGIAGVGAANAADSLRTLRGKYKNMFLLVDGYDYSNANAKNCSYAFDTMGFGAAVCAGRTVTGAWLDADDPEADYRALAVEAAERMKKNLLRYITIL